VLLLTSGRCRSGPLHASSYTLWHAIVEL
jgi:hypothetical protein